MILRHLIPSLNIHKFEPHHHQQKSLQIPIILRQLFAINNSHYVVIMSCVYKLTNPKTPKVVSRVNNYLPTIPGMAGNTITKLLTLK